ncbi:hypothetical protein [Paraburkholderia caffeinilytica]|uniref:Uncharacterized protein n=1 Tax=Paraburkholderia caffeinilytica TaxID=1761016 RepID=A0ABQ1MZP4_9BURK|nr:hypothetical protein [Paraburkholderia caffeinilytica]GGC48049.1 hypothetical protein GCM10011400_39160 [Paraburkholderia caffeinilytica]CAB3782631.1 hypothetical protein LMG28690_01415 [Paraburkholderia caffeinilytica]
MKLRLLTALASAALILAPSTAGALDSQQGSAVSGRTLMQNANESVQDTTDMSFGDSVRTAMPAGQPMQNVSYGGVTAGATDAGGRQERPCAAGVQCRIYFGQ